MRYALLTVFLVASAHAGMRLGVAGELAPHSAGSAETDNAMHAPAGPMAGLAFELGWQGEWVGIGIAPGYGYSGDLLTRDTHSRLHLARVPLQISSFVPLGSWSLRISGEIGPTFGLALLDEASDGDRDVSASGVSAGAHVGAMIPLDLGWQLSFDLGVRATMLSMTHGDPDPEENESTIDGETLTHLAFPLRVGFAHAF